MLDTSFGTNGYAELGVPWGGVPLVYKNIVIVGSNNGEVTLGPMPGDTRAFDARTGAKLWTFASVAQPGDPNHKTWLDDGWKNRQGVNHWGWYFTLDEQREILYTVFGSPAGNYWGGDRPGDESLWQLRGRAQREHREVSVALPVGASRSVGFRSAVAADAARCHRQRSQAFRRSV